MRTMSSSWRAIMMSALVIAISTAARPASGQTMSFSFYTDGVFSEDLSTFYTIVNGYDNSSGCQHGNYQTYASLSAPSGFYDNDFGYIGAQFDVPGLEGDYTISSNTTLECNCVGPLDAGGIQGELIQVRSFTARLVYSRHGSDPEPHTASSRDRYFNDDCSGFCQPTVVEYNHDVGMGHSWLEIKGFDTRRGIVRTCQARATPKTSRPACVPT